jgi:hypothetical protein
MSTTVLTSASFKSMLELLNRLETAKIAYTLTKVRPDAITARVSVPGERWEVEFADYGDDVQIEVERYVSSGEIADEASLDDLFARHSG